MKVHIENYRGWEISFDTDKEMFHYVSSDYDANGKKISYAAAKKFIDDFIKENQTFKAFWVEASPDSFQPGKKIKVVGIRKDGRFISENEKGEKDQISEYDLKNYIAINDENVELWDELALLKKDQNVLSEKIKAIKAKFTIKTLKEIKREINQ